jgi:hypothetical protein
MQVGFANHSPNIVRPSQAAGAPRQLQFHGFES